LKTFCRLAILAILALLCALAFAACDGNEGGPDDGGQIVVPPSEITVTFMSDGTLYKTVKVESGATMPVNPSKDGYIFVGWFLDDAALTQPFTGLSGVSANVTVYAKWVKDPGPEPDPETPPHEIFLAAVEVISGAGLVSDEMLANILEKYNALSTEDKRLRITSTGLTLTFTTTLNTNSFIKVCVLRLHRSYDLCPCKTEQLGFYLEYFKSSRGGAVHLING